MNKTSKISIVFRFEFPHNIISILKFENNPINYPDFINFNYI